MTDTHLPDVRIPAFEDLRLPLPSAQRLYAALAQFLSPHKRELFERNVAFRTRHLTVVLEDIYQSHNASACLRSCDCFGIQDVHIVEQRYAFRPNRDIALGATKWLTLHRYRGRASDAPDLTHAGSAAPAFSICQEPDAPRPADPRATRAGDGLPRPADATRQCFQQLRKAGYRIVVTAPRADAVPLEEYDIRSKTALVFGTELEGATEFALQAADQRLTIPMFGFTESFNISVAVAICLHHLVWKLHHSDVSWRLSPEEQVAVRLQWAYSVLRKRWRPLVERALREIGQRPASSP